MSAPAPQPIPGRLHTVSARGLTKLYGATPALRGVDLTLNAGEICLLVGPNGAGKSTLLNILGTQLRPTRGSVHYLDGKGSAISRPQLRAQLGWVSHASHCYGELSGRQNIELAAELHGQPQFDFPALASRLALGRFVEQPVSTLSRGQTQRVALARALVHRPSLLLLDEPWTGLDKKSGGLLEKIVLEEQTRNTVIVIVSHEAGLAERLGAREVEIRRGEVALTK